MIVIENNIITHKSNHPTISSIVLEPKEIRMYLGEDIQIRDGVNFNFILDLIYKNDDIFEILFNYELNSAKIKEFIDDFKFGKVSEHTTDINYILIRPLIDLCTDSLDVYYLMSGVDSNSLTYNISLISLINFKNKPIKLNNKIEFNGFNDSSIEEKEYELNEFTVYDFFKTFISEIAFWGNPKKRNLASEKLNKYNYKKA